MFNRFFMNVWVGNDLLYSRYFKSLNNAIKFAIGFDNECLIEIDDIFLDKTFSNTDVRSLCDEFKAIYESEVC